MLTVLLDERYRLLRTIGRGGMGCVWLADDEVLHREVAIKELILSGTLEPSELEEQRLRTLREARAAARLSHPNVVQIYDVIVVEDRPWIVMEYVPSRSLHEVVKKGEPLSPEQTAQIGLALLSALRAAHQAGVLHRDVKPSNVLLADDGRVVLTDFGLATFDGTDSAVTHTGVIVGSPQFMAPERAGDGTSSPEADLWSLGATLYSAVEGRPPYQRPTAIATLAALITTLPDPPQRAGALKPVLSGLLRKNPRSRMTPAEVETALRRIVAGQTRVRGWPLPRRRPRDYPGLGRSFDWTTDRPALDENTTIPRLDRMPVDPGTSFAPSPRPAGRRPGRADRRRWARRPGSHRWPILHRWPVLHRWPGRPWLLSAAVLVPLVAVGTAGLLAERSRPAAQPPPPGPSASARVTESLTERLPHSCAAPAGTAAPAPAGTAAPAPVGAVSGTGPGGYTLPPGWVWHTDPDGFSIGVPGNWVMSRADASVCFRDPGGSRVLGVERGKPGPGAIPALQARERVLIAAGGLPGYRRLTITKDPFRAGFAEWEYTYDGPVGRLHAIVRYDAGTAQSLLWLTPDFDWVQNRHNYDLIVPSFVKAGAPS